MNYYTFEVDHDAEVVIAKNNYEPDEVEKLPIELVNDLVQRAKEQF